MAAKLALVGTALVVLYVLAIVLVRLRYDEYTWAVLLKPLIGLLNLQIIFNLSSLPIRFVN